MDSSTNELTNGETTLPGEESTNSTTTIPETADVLADSYKDKITAYEKKFVKLKTIIGSLLQEKQQLKDKNEEDGATIEKLRQQVQKFQNSNQLFQNFQKLQKEYDKCQDEIDRYKKTNKNLESDFMRNVEELNNLKETVENQKEEIKSYRSHIDQQESQIEMQKESIKEYESKIIVLRTKFNDEQAKVQEYETNVEEINALKDELLAKTTEIHRLNEQLNDQTEKITDLERKIHEQNELIGKYENLQQENQNISNEIQQSRHIIESNREQLNRFNKKEEEYRSRIVELEKKLDEVQLANQEKISSMELEMYDLKNKLQLSEADLKNNNSRFEEYKSKVASVLKENKNKLNHCDYTRNLEMLNIRIQKLEEENKNLKIEYENLMKIAQHSSEEKSTMEKQLTSLKSQLHEHEVLKQSFNLLTTENDKLNTTIKQLQISFAKEKAQISDNNKEQLENLKIDLETKIKELEEELTRLRANANNILVNNNHNNNNSDDSNSIVNSNTSFEEIKDENSSIQSNVSSLEKNFLEEILSNDSSSMRSPVKNGLNVDNLTQLLEESENNISLLTEQNRVLKDEIRRLHRSIDRMDIANNLEYLKNVLIKFMTITRQDEKEQLIGVLSTILKLSPEESNVFQEFTPESHLQNKSNPKWNLWQWSS